MVPKVTAPLRKALHQLESEKQRIDHQLNMFRAALKALGGTTRRPPDTSTRPKRSQPQMSAAARRTVSQRMKAYWANQRAAKAKAREKTIKKG